MSVVVMVLLFKNHDEISNMVAVLIGALVTKLADALSQAYRWWFDTDSADEKA